MAINHNDPSSYIYDDYNALQNYYKLLAMPGRHFQARDFNVVQSMLLDLIKRLGDTIFKDGNIVEGCPITITGTIVTIGPGKIYHSGVVFDTEGAILEITGAGIELIGVKVEETIIDYDKDEDLLDPAVGTSAYLHPGCKRVKKTLVFTVDDDFAAVIVRLEDGQIQHLVTEAPIMDTMSEVLARRTFDESGNYVVSGFEILDPEYATEDEILVGLSKGKAYVKGYEVQRPADTTFSVPKSITTRTIEGEPKLATTSTNRYDLLCYPVSAVTRVYVTAEVTDTLNRGGVSGTVDLLPHTPVLQIVEVKQSTTKYLPGVDFVQVGNTIDWSPNGAEPITGTNYQVTYQYKTVLNMGTDYDVITDGNTTYIKLNTGKVVTGTEIAIDYDYYLARKDTICIDKVGKVHVIEGVPNDLYNIVAPRVTDNELLKLGEITVLPNSDRITKVNSTVRVSTMERIQNTIKRVDDLEYNQSITNLDKEAMENESPTELKGIFTDGFLNFNKIDNTFPGVAFSMDIEKGNLLLPFKESFDKLSIATDAANSYTSLGNVYCCKYNEVICLQQPYATQSMLVNPYQVFEPTMGVTIEPMVDNWIDTEKVTVENVNITEANLRKWWAHKDEAWAQEEKKLWEALGFKDGIGVNGDWSDYGNGRESSYLVHYSNEHVTGKSTKTVLDEAILYMRPINIKVSSVTFEGYEDNIQCKFAGINVPLTPIGSTTKGTKAGSVKADSKGRVEASFTIPKGIPCGTKEVELYSPQYGAITTFSAEGRRIVEEETIYIQRNVVHATDPLAQAFMVDTTCNITAVDIYFAEVDLNCPVCVQLRGCTNGYPNTTVYGECILAGYDLKTSTNGTIPTRFAFNNVIKCDSDQMYSIVVMTDSPKTSLYVAKLGDKDLEHSKYMTSNPYTAGTLFSSSNANTWTAHQDMDMKFTLYRADYQKEGCMVFNTVSTADADRLMLSLEHVMPMNTNITFEVSINDGDWMPTYPWFDFNYTYAIRKVQYRLYMKSDGYQSPLISKETASLLASSNDSKMVYVSRTISLPDTYSDIKVYFDSKLVSGATYKVYYCTDTTGSDWIELTNPEVVQLNEYWQQNYYHTELDQEYDTYRVKLEITNTLQGIRPAITRFMNILRII